MAHASTAPGIKPVASEPFIRAIFDNELLLFRPLLSDIDSVRSSEEKPTNPTGAVREKSILGLEYDLALSSTTLSSLAPPAEANCLG